MPKVNANKLILLITAVLLIWTAHPLMAASKVYTIQVSAHRTAAEAADRVSELASQGVEAYSSEETVAGRGVWYRVYVGRYANLAAARAHAWDLKNSGRISDFWVKMTTGQPEPVTPVAAAFEPEPPMIETAPMPVAVENDYPEIPMAETESPLSVYDRQATAMDTEASTLIGGGSAKAGTGQAEPDVVRFGQPREASLGGFSPYGPNQYVRGPFYVGMRVGVEQWLNAKDFTVSKTVGAHTTYYHVDSERAGFLTFTPGYRLNDFFTLEGMVERTWAGDIYGWTGGVGLKVGAPLANNLYTYGKINGLWSSFNWGGVPGKFKNDVGYEVAWGLDINMNRFKVGFELGYRSLEFEYEAPNTGGTYGGDSEIDLSSVRLSTSLSYAF